MTNDLAPPVPSEDTMRFTHFHVLTGASTCYACRAPTRVSAVLLESHDQADGEGAWDHVPDRAMVRYLGWMSEAPLAALLAAAPTLRRAYSQMYGGTYFANHCQQCQTLQGDAYLSDADEVFLPSSVDTLQAFDIERIDLAGELEGLPSSASWHDALTLPPASGAA